jgi:hypothetical protein
VRHEATMAGAHEVHILLNRTPIRGSPVRFDVNAAVPEVKTAKLFPPTADKFYSGVTYTTVLKTFDRFGNPILHGGLQVTGRCQLIKSGVHDLTTLMPSNHTVEIDDNGDGTYNVNVTLIKIAVTVKVIVNMDKNIPASGGELPPVQLTFLPNPASTGNDDDACAAAEEAETEDAAGAASEQAAGTAAGGSPKSGGERKGNLKTAATEVVEMLGAARDAAEPGMRPKATVAIAAEAFEEAGKKRAAAARISRRGGGK